MKPLHRKLAALGAAALLLAACGEDSNNTSSGRPAVEVALVAPLTGGNSTYATQMENSAQLAATQYNESTDAECTLNVTAYDDRGTAEDTTRVAQRAISADGAQALVGGYAGVEALALKEFAERRSITYLSTSSLALALTEDASYTFRVSPNLLDYPNSYAAFLAGEGYRSPAIIGDDSPTGEPLAQPLADALEEAGVTPAGPPIIFPANSTDLTATVQQASDQNPDAVIVLGSVAADQGLIVRTASEQGLDVPLIANSAIASRDAQQVGGDAYDASEIYTFNNTDPAKPEYVAYLDAYAAEFGETDGTISEAADQTYDAVLLLGAALDENDCEATGPELAAAIHALPPQPAAAAATGVQLSFADGQEGFVDAELVPFRLADSALEPVS